MSEVSRTTIVFPRGVGRVLLGMKKRGFGEGWWNGFGGKLESETWEESARRETFDESRLAVGQLRLVARLLFYFNDELRVMSKAYTTHDFTGNFEETDEMRPQWFSQDALPYDYMWPADRHWIPQALVLEESEGSLGFVVYFDGDKNFLRIEDADKETLDAYFQD